MKVLLDDGVVHVESWTKAERQQVLELVQGGREMNDVEEEMVRIQYRDAAGRRCTSFIYRSGWDSLVAALRANEGEKDG